MKQKARLFKGIIAIALALTLAVAGAGISPMEAQAKTTTNDWTYMNKLGTGSQIIYLFNCKSVKIKSGKLVAKAEGEIQSPSSGRINKGKAAFDEEGRWYFDWENTKTVTDTTYKAKLASKYKIVMGYYDDDGSNTYHETTKSADWFNKKSTSYSGYGKDSCEIAVRLNSKGNVTLIYLFDGSNYTSGEYKGADLF